MVIDVGYFLGKEMARGGGFEPPYPRGHRISNPTPYRARRSPHEDS